jgi:hypothetical protein
MILPNCNKAADAHPRRLPTAEQADVKTKEAQNGTRHTSVAAPYHDCKVHEDSWAQVDFRRLKVEFFKTYWRNQPFFSQDTPPESVAPETSKEQRRASQIQKQLEDAIKYRDLIELLKKAINRRTRLFLIARWLTAEGVCEPEDIIGSTELQKHARKMFSFFSSSDFQNADRVRAWLPYFERLHHDQRDGTSRQALLEVGYEETAVDIDRNKRSPIAAACEWLAKTRPSLNVTASALANSYSRLYGQKRFHHFSVD